jgi:ankyrin repeat protein
MCTHYRYATDQFCDEQIDKHFAEQQARTLNGYTIAESEQEPEAQTDTVNQDQAERDCGGGFKKTSLMLAARDNTPEVAAMALDCSATQQAIDVVDEHGRTAVMTAAMHGSMEVVRVLCNAGAELDARDCDGKQVRSAQQTSPEIHNSITVDDRPKLINDWLLCCAVDHLLQRE